jgi:hypothetical protein
MSFSRNPYHSESTHGAVISTTVGMAIRNLHREIERRDPEWFSISEVPVAQLAQLGLLACFDSEGKVILEKLPDIYQRNSSTISILGSAHLSKGSLFGLQRLLGLEPDPAKPSQNFKDFAIGVFLRCEKWDEILIEGKQSTIHLDEAFSCVFFGLTDETIYSSPRRVEENLVRLLKQINETNSPLLACSTGRRHDLVGALGKEEYPGIFVFADDMEFIRQSAEQYLQQKLTELSSKNLVAYQQILNALIHRPGLTWADEIEIEAGSLPGLGGSAEVGRSISVLDFLVRVNAESISGAGAGAGAGSGTASGSSLESASEAEFSDWIRPLRLFVMGRLGDVGLVKAGGEGTEDLVAAEARESYQKKLNQSVSESDIDLARDFLGRLPVTVAQEKCLSLQRMAYLFKTYPTSSAVAFVRTQDPTDLVALGETASQLSGYLDSLRATDLRGIINEERDAAVGRFREALLPLRDKATKPDEIKRMLTPKFRETICADQALVEDFIRERSSGRNAFIGSFFACYAHSHSIELRREERNSLITILIKELLSLESPITEEWIEAYQARHRSGVVLTLDPPTVNLILLHALRTPVSERTPVFNETLGHMLAFIRRSFAEKPGDAPSELDESLKKSSYNEALLTLIESGGCLGELYLINHRHVRDLLEAMHYLYSQELTDELKHLTIRKVTGTDILQKILYLPLEETPHSVYHLKKKIFKIFLTQKDLLDKIQEGEFGTLCPLIAEHELWTKDLCHQFFDDPVPLLAKISNSFELEHVINILVSRRFKKQSIDLMQAFLAQENLIEKKIRGSGPDLYSFIRCSILTKVSINACLASHPEWVNKVGNLQDLKSVIKILREARLAEKIQPLVQAFFESEVEKKIQSTRLLIEGVALLKEEGFFAEVRVLLQAFLSSSIEICDTSEFSIVIPLFKAEGFSLYEMSILAKNFVKTSISKIGNAALLMSFIQLLRTEGFNQELTDLLKDPKLFTRPPVPDFSLLLANFKAREFFHEMFLYLETKITHDSLTPLTVVQALKEVGLSPLAEELLIQPTVITKIQNVNILFELIYSIEDSNKKSVLFRAFMIQEEVMDKVQNINQLNEILAYGASKVEGFNPQDILRAFMASPNFISKIYDGDELYALINLLRKNGLEDRLKRILVLPTVAFKINSESQLRIVIQSMIEMKLSNLLGEFLSGVNVSWELILLIRGTDTFEILKILEQNGLVEEMRYLIHHPKKLNCDRLVHALKKIVQDEIATLSPEEQKTTSIQAIKTLFSSKHADGSPSKLMEAVNEILDASDNRTTAYDSSLAYRLFHGRRSLKVEAVYRKIRLYFSPPDVLVSQPSGAFAFSTDLETAVCPGGSVGGAGAPAGGYTDPH